MRKIVVLAATVLLLVGMNWGIYQKESLLNDGRIVLLKLAPVDPRSLMQGDYMALRFSVPVPRSNSDSVDGRVVLGLDERGVAAYRRIDNGSTLAGDEIVMRYRIRQGQIKFATNAFFFQEGEGHRYENAEYGEFRVSDSGDSLLTGLRDKDLHRLGGEK